MSTTFDVSIDRTDLSLSPLVLHGTEEQYGWCLMPDVQIPGLEAETRSVGSEWLHGSPAMSFTWRDGIFSGSLYPMADDAAGIRELVEEMRAAIGRLSYPMTTSWGGDDQVWTARPGSLAPSPLSRIAVVLDRPVYTLTIPCHPIPGA